MRHTEYTSSIHDYPQHRHCAGPRSSRSHFFGHRDSGRGGHGRGEREGPGRGFIDSTELRLLMLRLLEEQPRHGYDIMRDIEARTAGAYVPSPGMVYPALTMLEEIGHIAQASSDGAKRLFTLTDAGLAHLTEHRAAADAALARLDALGRDWKPIDTGPVRRAMQNLATVLQTQLTGTPDKETLFAAAEIIDDAARRIERL